MATILCGASVQTWQPCTRERGNAGRCEGPDAVPPKGPWITAYAKHAPHIYSVLIPDRRWAFTGDRQEAEAVRDALNRLKGDEK